MTIDITKNCYINCRNSNGNRASRYIDHRAYEIWFILHYIVERDFLGWKSLIPLTVHVPKMEGIESFSVLRGKI